MGKSENLCENLLELSSSGGGGDDGTGEVI